MKRELPQDPMLRDLVQMARNHQISRRAALAGVGGTAAALTLASCAPADEGQVAEWAGSFEDMLDAFFFEAGIDGAFTDFPDRAVNFLRDR